MFDSTDGERQSQTAEMFVASPTGIPALEGKTNELARSKTRTNFAIPRNLLGIMGNQANHPTPHGTETGLHRPYCMPPESRHWNQGTGIAKITLHFKVSGYDLHGECSNGAANQTNLETASLHSILDELEEWEAFLKAEPELIHKLRSFDEAAKPSQEPPSPARPSGPSL